MLCFTLACGVNRPSFYTAIPTQSATAIPAQASSPTETITPTETAPSTATQTFTPIEIAQPTITATMRPTPADNLVLNPSFDLRTIYSPTYWAGMAAIYGSLQQNGLQ